MYTAIAERGDMQGAGTFLPIIHLVSQVSGPGAVHQHPSRCQSTAPASRFNEFTICFNRRFYPFNACRSLLGIAGGVTAPTYAELHAKKTKGGRAENGNGELSSLSGLAVL